MPARTFISVGLPAPVAICHGDLHPRNILVEEGRVTGVLDWPNVLVADPAFDLAATWSILRFVPAALTGMPAARRWLARLVQPALAARYRALYWRRRPIDRARLRYYEVAAALRALVRVDTRGSGCASSGCEPRSDGRRHRPDKPGPSRSCGPLRRSAGDQLVPEFSSKRARAGRG